MLATGQNCLPAGGIGAIAEQLASWLPAHAIYTSMPCCGCLALGRRDCAWGVGQMVLAAEGVCVCICAWLCVCGRRACALMDFGVVLFFCPRGYLPTRSTQV
jgi:hypothetical protein